LYSLHVLGGSSGGGGGAYQRNSDGRHCLSWNSAPLLPRALSLPLLDKPLLIYLLNNTTAALARFSLISAPSLSSLNGLLYAPSLSTSSGRYCFTGSVESCGLCYMTTQGEGAPREGRGCKLKRLDWGMLRRERSDYRK